MSRLASCFDDDMQRLLERAGAVAPRVRAPAVSAPVSAAPAQRTLVEQIAAMKEPDQRAIGAALSAIVTDISRLVGTPFFVADHDGLLLAGSGDAPAMAASVAADATRGIMSGAGVTAAKVEGLLLSAAPHEFLVCSYEDRGRVFVVGAQVAARTSISELRAAIERISQTLLLRLKHV